MKAAKKYVPRELSQVSREKSRNLPSLKHGKKPVGRVQSKDLLLKKGGNKMKLEKVNFPTES
jgi:hypothetical protein